MSTEQPRLMLVVADGVRPDVLQQEIDAGRAPAMASLLAHGGLHRVTSSFPSVTGPAYVPFLMGRHAGSVGLPGLRWYDRSRTLRCVRAAIPHFRGDTLGWRTVERAATAAFLRHFAAAQPRFSILAITSPDKFSHKYGSDSEPVRNAITDVDTAIGRAMAIATKGGWREALRVWVVSDHGHAPVRQHDDLHGWLESQSLRVLAHPRLHTRNPDLALMVGGNAMAHIYLDPSSRTREWWPTHAPRWTRLHDAVVAREPVDLVAVAISADAVRVSHATRGTAEIRWDKRGDGIRFDYDAHNGDALQLGGSHRALDDRDAWTLCATSPYPDSIVQLLTLCTSSRAGDIVLSAADGWDLRDRFEPVPHVSTHGALLRDQMYVPLLLDAPVGGSPQRTADVMPSVLAALGLPIPPGLEGRSFL